MFMITNRKWPTKSSGEVYVERSSMRSCGAMDNASDYGSEDSRFDSWQDRREYFFVILTIKSGDFHLKITKTNFYVYSEKSQKSWKVLTVIYNFAENTKSIGQTVLKLQFLEYLCNIFL